jgi:hypothetical protein
VPVAAVSVEAVAAEEAAFVAAVAEDSAVAEAAGGVLTSP